MVIPYQVAQADRIQRDQTAREIYREFLNLTVQKPELATADYCALKDTNQTAAYSAYVEYMLYTAEQMVATSPDWQKTMLGYLTAHAGYLCDPEVQAASDGMAGLVAGLGLACTPQRQCR